MYWYQYRYGENKKNKDDLKNEMIRKVETVSKINTTFKINSIMKTTDFNNKDKFRTGDDLILDKSNFGLRLQQHSASISLLFS